MVNREKAKQNSCRKKEQVLEPCGKWPERWLERLDTVKQGVWMVLRSQ
jgi:hypothetical protein